MGKYIHCHGRSVCKGTHAQGLEGEIKAEAGGQASLGLRLVGRKSSGQSGPTGTMEVEPTTVKNNQKVTQSLLIQSKCVFLFTHKHTHTHTPSFFLQKACFNLTGMA